VGERRDEKGEKTEKGGAGNDQGALRSRPENRGAENPFKRGAKKKGKTAWGSHRGLVK